VAVGEATASDAAASCFAVSASPAEPVAGRQPRAQRDD